jgi:hypothetical protein
VHKRERRERERRDASDLTAADVWRGRERERDDPTCDLTAARLRHPRSTGFMATPLVFGQLFLLDFALKNALPALSNGLSTLPPPAMIPTVALA